MIDFIPPDADKIEWSPAGLQAALTDFMNTPLPQERIIPEASTDLLLGLALLAPGLLVFFG